MRDAVQWLVDRWLALPIGLALAAISIWLSGPDIWRRRKH